MDIMRFYTNTFQKTRFKYHHSEEISYPISIHPVGKCSTLYAVCLSKQVDEVKWQNGVGQLMSKSKKQ